MMTDDLLKRMLVLDESEENELYQDSVGKWSIGIGRNLSDRGIRDDEIDLMYTNDVNEVKDELKAFDWATGHDSIRQLVIIDMCFNLGLTRLLGFKKMIAALEEKSYTVAADEMMDSKWARQVGPRADRLFYMMMTGDIHPDYE